MKSEELDFIFAKMDMTELGLGFSGLRRLIAPKFNEAQVELITFLE